MVVSLGRFAEDINDYENSHSDESVINRSIRVKVEIRIVIKSRVLVIHYDIRVVLTRW